MASNSIASEICSQISGVFDLPISTPTPLATLVTEISGARSRNGGVFVYGVGREGLMMRALCMRLAHLGLRAHCVFDMTTPAIGPDDLLIASAGPGGFCTVDAICGVAVSSGARVVLLTARPDLVKAQVTVVAHLPAQTMADDASAPSLLPMGSLYEGALYVLFEMVVFHLTNLFAQTPTLLRSRHTNLE